MLVYRHINGISLNGREYLLGANGLPKEFDSEEEAKDYMNIPQEDDLFDHGVFLTDEDEAGL